jgi:glycosyltransferase 2 family protein
LNWRLLAIPASIIPLIIMVLFTRISTNDLFAVGLFPFIASTICVLTKIILQGFRFRYFIKEFIGHNVSSVGKTIAARLAGEFVTQTTPSYVGGELVRIAWLTRNGVPTGKAAWVTTTEIIADVFVGTILAFIAGGLAIYNGGTFIGVVIILVTIPTFVFWFLLIAFSVKNTLRMPIFSLKIIQKFVGREKAEKIFNNANIAIADLCKMSRHNFNSRKAIKTFATGILITFIAFLLQGMSFMILANSVNSNISLFQSIMSTSASTALSNLPITIGGSGLAELGIWAYLSNLNNIMPVKNVDKSFQLSVIVVWRIASYHIPLIIMWFALMKLALGKKASQSLH